MTSLRMARGTTPMADELVLRLTLGDSERRALRGVLLGARAAELAEVKRRGGRHAFGYGTDSARETMSADADDARRKMDLLDRLIAAVAAAQGGRDAGAGGSAPARRRRRPRRAPRRQACRLRAAGHAAPPRSSPGRPPTRAVARPRTRARSGGPRAPDRASTRRARRARRPARGGSAVLAVRWFRRGWSPGGLGAHGPGPCAGGPGPAAGRGGTGR